MNYSDIVARIQKGESVEDMVKEFTDNINKAQAEVKAQEAEKVAAAEKDARLNEIADRIAVALQDYLTIMGIETEGLTGAEIRDMLDEFAPLLESLKNLKVKVEKLPTKKTNPDEVFGKWFKMMNW